MSAVSLIAVGQLKGQTAPYRLGSIDKYYNSITNASIEYTIPSVPKSLLFLRDKILSYTSLANSMPTNFISRYGDTSYSCLIEKLEVSQEGYINLFFTAIGNAGFGDLLPANGSVLEANGVGLTLIGITEFDTISGYGFNNNYAIIKRVGKLIYSYPSGNVSNLSFIYRGFGSGYTTAVIPFLQFKIIATVSSW